jgi:protein-disulfide isomerase
MDKKFVTIIVVIALVLGGIFFFTRDKSQGTNATGTPSNHVFGNTTSKVTLTEYGDFECPACGTYYPLIDQVKTKYKDQIAFKFISFPLPQHQNARAAHRAAEAANLQGKFWEMYDQLYSQQQNWTSLSNPLNTFKSYAQTIGLDIAKFDTDYASDAVNAAINADKKLGEDFNVTATPTFAINGKKFEPTRGTIDEFSEAIDAALKAAGMSPSSTATPTASAQ